MTQVVPRLWRSTEDKKLAGVLGGAAERFDMDPTLVRVIYSVGALITGFIPLLAVYILLWVITEPRSDGGGRHWMGQE